MSRHKCEAVACLSSHVKCNFYELLYCVLCLWRINLIWYIFATKACIDNRKKIVKQQYLLYMSPQYGERRPTSGWDLLVSLRYLCKFQRVSRLSSVTARHSSSGPQPNFAALDRGRHLYSAWRPSRWSLAHISREEYIENLYIKQHNTQI